MFDSQSCTIHSNIKNLSPLYVHFVPINNQNGHGPNMNKNIKIGEFSLNASKPALMVIMKIFKTIKRNRYCASKSYLNKNEII